MSEFLLCFLIGMLGGITVLALTMVGYLIREYKEMSKTATEDPPHGYEAVEETDDAETATPA